jgi:hypothetical protein
LNGARHERIIHVVALPIHSRIRPHLQSANPRGHRSTWTFAAASLEKGV